MTTPEISAPSGPALVGPMAEVRMTLQITRKATGMVEEVELVGFVNPEKLKELENDRHPNH